MPPSSNPDTIVDFITGQKIANVGSEANRQLLERFLIENKAYTRADIVVDAPIAVEIKGEMYRSTVDLVIQIDGVPLMAVKCAAGSLGSREREVVSAARLYAAAPLPLAIVSDGSDAAVLDTQTGKPIGKGLDAIPSRRQAARLGRAEPLPPIAPQRLTREKLIFRSYDSMNVNVRGRSA